MKTNSKILLVLMCFVCSCHTTKKTKTTIEGSEIHKQSFDLGTTTSIKENQYKQEIEKALTEIFARGSLFIDVVEECTIDTTKTQLTRKETHLRASFEQNANITNEKEAEITKNDSLLICTNLTGQEEDQSKLIEQTKTIVKKPVFNWSYLYILLFVLSFIFILLKLKPIIKAIKWLFT